MAKKFDLNDDSVVVIIGSGAGGGTLGNELAQKGVNVVCLEAGKKLSLDDIENDWGAMFGKLSWVDKRQGTGDLLAGLPLWVCKTVGGTTVHWAGASLRFKDQSSGLQLQNLKRIDGSDFFETVRGATLAGLYGNPRVAALFGWEGSSVEHGGYINRGFNDIGWLPKS